MERNERRYIPRSYAQYSSNAASDLGRRRASATPSSSDRENPYFNRRRTADSFLGTGIEYSGSSLVRPTLTASATMNDLENPSFKPSRPRFPLVKRFTPTRIPSPVRNTRVEKHHASTPVLPSQNTPKENKNHGGTGRIPSSNKTAPLLPKSRTVGMLSNFTAPFLRQTHTTGRSRQASRSSRHPADGTNSDPNFIPLPLFTANAHQIYNSNTNSYWCGRFQAVCDRLDDEYLLINSDIMRQCDTDDSDSSSDFSPSTDKEKKKPSPFEDDCVYNSERNKTSTNKNEDQDERSSRAFLHLKSLCANNEARRSLREFQLQFARIKGKPYLLPKGGKMTDDRGGWLGRVGRAMVGSNNTGPARRSSLRRSRRMSSVVSFLNH